MMPAMHPDSEVIKRLGGVAEVARKLGYGEGGIQRVHNWLRRGIPPKVKLERPDLFLRRKPQPADKPLQRRHTDDHPSAADPDEASVRALERAIEARQRLFRGTRER